jgi:hypothetical protein
MHPFMQKEFYERQNTMLAHAAARTGKRGRRRDTFHFDQHHMCPGSPSSAALSGVSGECGSYLHGNLGNVMEGVKEEDDANITGFSSGEHIIVSGAVVKRARYQGMLFTLPAQQTIITRSAEDENFFCMDMLQQCLGPFAYVGTRRRGRWTARSHEIVSMLLVPMISMFV